MITKKEIEDLRKGMWDTAKKNIIRDGHLEPVIIMVMGNKDCVMTPVNCGESREDMLNYYAAAHDFARVHGPVAVFIINESWMVQVHTEEEARNSGPPSEHPDRFDAIVLTHIVPTGEQAMLSAKVIQDGENVTLEELDNAPSGKMECNIFPPWETAQ